MRSAPSGPASHDWTDKKYLKMDAAFQQAMAKAIRRGREHATIGVCTAPGTTNPTLVIALPFVRGTATSPAAACRALGFTSRTDKRALNDA